MYMVIPAVAPARTKPTLPRQLSASSWDTVYKQAWDRVQSAHGIATDSEGTIAPRLTNAEAITLIAAVRAQASHRFPLWYQFAAVAYGWGPDSDVLDQGETQGRAAYIPDDVDVALWVEIDRVFIALENERVANENANPPRLYFDTTFADPVFAGLVAAQLKQDGADAAFKIPTGVCKDPKTGKRRLYRPCPPGAKRGPDGRSYYKDPITGADIPCDGKGDCAPVLIDDPVTKIGKDVITLVLILGAVWWIAKRKPSRRTRRMQRS